MMLPVRVAALFLGVAAGGLVVNTSLGPVEGNPAKSNQCASFYGIPYAAPPIGTNRFKPPQPGVPWHAPRGAYRVGKSCMQPFGDGALSLPPSIEHFAEKFLSRMGEDCLYLNVFTPQVHEKASLPVMVWIHGGSYLGGSGDYQTGFPIYDGHRFCRDGDVVLVSVNYRMGIFGFHTSDELLTTEGTAGNMGIQDQRAALQWVQANARAFGGDPNRVTIFGESAGGGSVVSHLSFEKSAPYFHAAIVESGGLWVRRMADAVDASDAAAKVAGCVGESNTLACLRKVPAYDLLHAQIKGGWGYPAGNYSSGPTADGHELPMGSVSRDVLRNGNFHAKPIMVGANRNESALFDCLSTPSSLSEAGFRQKLSDTLKKGHVNATQAELDHMVALYDAKLYGGSWKRAAIDMDTDVAFNCGSRFVLSANAKKGQPTYAYHLLHPWSPMKLYPCLGVPHATDVIFLFENVNPLLSKDEKDLGSRMLKYWTDFARNHKPSDSWPAYDAKAQQYLTLDVPADTPQANWHRDQCDAWDALQDKMGMSQTVVV